jgi:pyruvate dehydrogenase phosphatase
VPVRAPLEASALKDVSVCWCLISQVDDLWSAKIHQRFVAGEVDLALAGSCALVSLVRDNTLYVANTGDSRAILVSVDQTGRMHARDMSNDHNVNSEREVAILESRHPGEPRLLGDGRQLRVKGRIKVTRSLGDMYLKDQKYNQLPLPPIIQVRRVTPPSVFFVVPYCSHHRLWVAI